MTEAQARELAVMLAEFSVGLKKLSDVERVSKLENACARRHAVVMSKLLDDHGQDPEWDETNELVEHLSMVLREVGNR